MLQPHGRTKSSQKHFIHRNIIYRTAEDHVVTSSRPGELPPMVPRRFIVMGINSKCSRVSGGRSGMKDSGDSVHSSTLYSATSLVRDTDSQTDRTDRQDRQTDMERNRDRDGRQGERLVRLHPVNRKGSYQGDTNDTAATSKLLIHCS